MIKKVLYIGSKEVRDKVIQMTGTDDAYVVEVTTIGAAEIILERLDINQIIMECIGYSRRVVEFSNFLERNNLLSNIPLTCFRLDQGEIIIINNLYNILPAQTNISSLPSTT